MWLSTNAIAGNAVPAGGGFQAHRRAKVAGHSSGKISLLQGGSGRLFTPEGHLYATEEREAPVEAMRPKADGSGRLNDIIFADYAQKVRPFVAFAPLSALLSRLVL